MKIHKSIVGVTTALAVLTLGGPLSCAGQAKHDHSAHEHADHSASPEHSAAPVVRDYADAIGQIQNHMTLLDAIIKSGKYDAVHKDCLAIEKVCDSLGDGGGLAAAQGSPIPKDKVNDVSESAKQLAATSRSLHKAAHADDLPQVKADYARMGELVGSLARYVHSR